MLRVFAKADHSRHSQENGRSLMYLEPLTVYFHEESSMEGR